MGGLRTISDQLARMKQNPSWNVILESAGCAASGAAFGAALTAAGVHLPEVIINQFRLSNFHMFQVFSVALGSSVFIILAMDKLNVATRQVRPNTSLGLFSQYDGNLVGGVLVGLGMSMSGSCPGTVTAQLGQRIPSAGITALGGLVGGMVHLWFTQPVKKHGRSKSTSPPRSVQESKPPQTISRAIGIREQTLYIAVGAAWLALLYFGTPRNAPFWRSATAGGLYLGGAQLISILATSSTLGASGIYDQAGRHVWRALGNKEIAPAPFPPRSLLFGIGAIAGSMALTKIFPTLDATATIKSIVPWSSAFAGGFVMAFGAKVAKGCTSGHGLSGMGALSLPSLITVASMFGAGILSQFL